MSADGDWPHRPFDLAQERDRPFARPWRLPSPPRSGRPRLSPSSIHFAGELLRCLLSSSSSSSSSLQPQPRPHRPPPASPSNRQHQPLAVICSRSPPARQPANRLFWPPHFPFCLFPVLSGPHVSLATHAVSEPPTPALPATVCGFSQSPASPTLVLLRPGPRHRAPLPVSSPPSLPLDPIVFLFSCAHPRGLPRTNSALLSYARVAVSSYPAANSIAFPLRTYTSLPLPTREFEPQPWLHRPSAVNYPCALHHIILPQPTTRRPPTSNGLLSRSSGRSAIMCYVRRSVPIRRSFHTSPIFCSYAKS